MKILKTFAIAILLSLTFMNSGYAQGDENRTKLTMTITYGGKTVVTELNSISTSVTRSPEEETVGTKPADTAKNKMAALYPGSCYLSIDAKRVTDDLLKVFAKKQTRFNGVITIVDTYGKYPTRTMKFNNASLYSYSDQAATSTYNDSYGSTSISFFCKELSINGIVLEQ